jgi:hypothetical protein
MLSASLVTPGHNHVVPLKPEFIKPRDGTEKQDCETRAARRWLTAHGSEYKSLNPVYLGDDLYSRQPTCEAVLVADSHFIFICKPDSYPLIQEYITGIRLPTLTLLVKRGRKRFTHRYRWLPAVPLRDWKDALLVDCFEIEIWNETGDVTYRNSFITDLPVHLGDVQDRVA